MHLVKNINNHIDQYKYSQIIGSLLYLSNRSRLDIPCATFKLSKCTANSNLVHWNAHE